MEKSRLISLSKKFSRTNPKLQDPKSVYSELVGTKEYEVFLSRLKGEDIALLCFLIPFAKITEDLGPIYDKIFVNLFTFSLIQIDEIEPEIYCPSCDSKGYIECAECDGDGEEGCYECGGNGENYASDEDGGGACNTCKGSGNIKCSGCDGIGDNPCQTCDGNGYINDEDSVSILISSYISYDESIYLTFETRESDGEYETPMSENMYDTIIKNNKTFLMSDDMKNVSDIFNIYKINVNDVYFGALNKELSLSLSPYKKLEDNNLDSI